MFVKALEIRYVTLLTDSSMLFIFVTAHIHNSVSIRIFRFSAQQDKRSSFPPKAPGSEKNVHSWQNIPH